MGDLFDLQELRTHVGLVDGVMAWRAWRPQADDPLSLTLPRVGGRGLIYKSRYLAPEPLPSVGGRGPIHQSR